MVPNPKEIQENYYQNSPQSYDSMHLQEGDEHFLSLHILSGLMEFYKVQSVLDVGAGTGRVALFLHQRFPNLRIISIEPVKALREIGYEKGLSRNELIEGDAVNLDFKDDEFDLVCAFGVFHHLPDPKMALSEMKRVSSQYIFISDSNNFGTGKTFSRTVKQVLNRLHLWKMIVFLKTRGRMYKISDGDGLFYSFSIFNLIPLLKNYSVFPFSTSPSRGNIYRDATHVALFARTKK